MYAFRKKKETWQLGEEGLLFSPLQKSPLSHLPVDCVLLAPSDSSTDLESRVSTSVQTGRDVSGVSTSSAERI